MRALDFDLTEADAISLADEDRVNQVLLDSVLSLGDVVDNLIRLRPSTQERYRVTLLGPAWPSPGSPTYEETKRIAAALAGMDCEIFTSGGPGLRMAANEGVQSAQGSGNSGKRVARPFVRDISSLAQMTVLHPALATCLQHFPFASDAFVVAPGGLGAVLETTMVWQYLHAKGRRDAALILVGTMWREFVDWARSSMLLADTPLASAEEIALPRCAKNADEAIMLVSALHDQWRARR
jgi:predicted Rossmann-fold nucleotide-binding protein